MAHSCPVCAYPKLTEPPRSGSGGGSYEICPSCGFQFGVSDDDQGITPAQWRRKWTAAGSPWFSQSIAAPAGWDAAKQLKRIKPSASAKGKKNSSRAKR